MEKNAFNKMEKMPLLNKMCTQFQPMRSFVCSLNSLLLVESNNMSLE